MATESNRPPLILNFSHPFNLACRQQLDRSLPGWRQWRPASNRVDDPAHPLSSIDSWLKDLERQFPHWREAHSVYHSAHALSTINTALLQRLQEQHGVCLLEIVREPLRGAALDCFVVARIGDENLDLSLGTLKIPGFIVDLGLRPLSDDHLEQIRTRCGPGFELRRLHQEFPRVKKVLTAEQIDRFILGLAQSEQVQWDEQPYVLAWFQRSGVPNNVVRFVARFHGVTGYFPAMVQFGLKQEYEGATEASVLDDVDCWEVTDIQKFSDERVQGARLRTSTLSESPVPTSPPPSSTEILPSAVALMAFQWPHWTRSHSEEDLGGHSPGRHHLDRLDGVLQPGNTPARTAVDRDISASFTLFRSLLDWARPWDAAPVLAAIRQYLASVGARHEQRTMNIAELPDRLACELTKTPQVEIVKSSWPVRRVAVDAEQLVRLVVKPLLNNALRFGATRVAISGRQGRNEDTWTLEIRNDGMPMGSALGTLHEATGAGTEQLLAFADGHLATIRVYSREGDTTCRRTRSGGSYRWVEHRTSLELRPASAVATLREWEASRTASPQRSLPDPWRVSWEIEFDLTALGEPV